MNSSQTAPSPSHVAVFVCSSDSRRDVVDRVLPSILKFWPDCPYPIYVGLNTCDRPLLHGTPILASPSEWCSEFSSQLAHLEEDYLIVILDDFLIRRPVDQMRMEKLVQQALTLNLTYLRLLPLGRSLPARLVSWRPPERVPGIERIRERRPFYSALQIAIWRKDHLQTMLRSSLSIWDFEHLCVPDSQHCAIKDDPPIHYRHLVERGRWLPDARSLLQRAGFPGDLGVRPVWSSSRYVRLFLDQVRWTLLGYATC